MSVLVNRVQQASFSLRLMEPLANTSLLADFIYDPIKSTRVVEGQSTLYYTRNGEEFKLTVGCVNGKKEGDAALVNEDNTIVANLHFVDDKLNGECILRNENYYVIFRGMMKDGHKEGECHEYDNEGNEVFYGFYQNGERIPLLEENATMKGFYNEYAMQSRELKTIAEYDEKRSSKKGRCFFYKNGKLEKESWMESNVERYVVREFVNNQMIEYYENGVKKYEGDYKMIDLLDIRREGEGIEYNASGEMTYKGAFVDGEPAVTFETVKGMKGFMEEKQKGVTLCIGQFNPNGMMKDGTCFEFKKGRVKKECIYANNTLVRVVREFSKHKMTEYDENQKKCYEGGFSGDYVVGFRRSGEGKEYKNDQVVYKGEFLDGCRHGEGVYFRNQVPFYRGTWSDNYPQGDGVLLNAKGEIERQGEWDRGMLDTGTVVIDFETGREMKRSSRCCNRRGRKKKVKSLLSNCCYRVLSAIYLIVTLIIAYFLIGFLVMNVLLYKQEGSLSLHSCYAYHKLPFTSRWYLYDLKISASHCFYPFQYANLTMNHFGMLASLTIGDNSFPETNEFIIDSLPVLKTLSIGMNAFTRSPNSMSAVTNRRLQISNCESLETIQIGRYAFSDYSALELVNLPALLALTIGNQEDSSNFYYAAKPSFMSSFDCLFSRRLSEPQEYRDRNERLP